MIVVSILVVLVILMLIVFHNPVKKSDISNYAIGDIKEINYEIENLIYERDTLYVEGFCYKNTSYTYYNYGMHKDVTGYYNNFALATIDKGIVYEFPTKLVFREDINNSHSGFNAMIANKYTTFIQKNGLYIVVTSPDQENTLYKLEEGVYEN